MGCASSKDFTCLNNDNDILFRELLGIDYNELKKSMNIKHDNTIGYFKGGKFEAVIVENIGYHRICCHGENITTIFPNKSTYLHIICHHIVISEYLKNRIHTYHDLIRNLLETGANPNQCDEYNMTPLHIISKSNVTFIAKLLIDYGSSHESEDIFACTPYMISRKYKKQSMQQFLQQYNKKLFTIKE
jgi:hypothetical protein